MLSKSQDGLHMHAAEMHTSDDEHFDDCMILIIIIISKATFCTDKRI